MTTPIATLTDIHRTYGGGENPVHALRGVSAEFHRDTVTAIVGRSGSGKSTMLNILGLLDRPDSGGYTLGSVAMFGLTERRRARVRASHVGFVFQQFHLLAHRTAAENVELAMQPTRIARRHRATISHAPRAYRSLTSPAGVDRLDGTVAYGPLARS